MTLVKPAVSKILGALALLAGLTLVVATTDHFQSFGSWLVLRYLAYAAVTAFFSLAVTGAGLRVVDRLTRLRAPERWVLSFSVGTLVFGTAVELGGFLSLLGDAFAILLPASMVILGWRPLKREGRLIVRLMKRPSPLATTDLLLAGATLCCVVLLYAKVAVPAHAGYDSRWYHLPAAEHYAATGAVRPFREGWILGAYPQLMTYLYTWAFVWPFRNLFDHVGLAAHVEFALLLGMLFSLPAIARRAAGVRNGFRALPLVFTFPALFMYGPQCEADMLASLFGAATALSVLIFWQRPTRGAVVLVALAMAGMFTTKLSTAAALAPAAMIVVLRLLVAKNPATTAKSRLQIATWFGLAFLAASSSHWLKNWAFYGDPLFPLFVKHLPAHPLTKQGREILTYFWPHEVWRPPATWQGLKESATVAFTFAFSPHEFTSVGQGWPIFGFLFTCCLLILPFSRPRQEVWLLAGGTTLGVFVWFWVHHQDRYLQVLLPWMVAVCFATFRWAWAQGVIHRALTSLLVAVQLAWGSDVFFHHAPLEALLGLIKSAREGQTARRQQLDVFEPMAEVGRHLPARAHVLVHEMHDHFGLQAASVSDFAGWQTGISYVEESTPAEVHALLERMGVTHVLWKGGQSEGMSSLGADLAFFRYVHDHTNPTRRQIGPFLLAELPTSPPQPSRGEDLTYVLGCGDSYATGIYPLRALDVRAIDPPPPADYPRPRWPISDKDAPLPETVDTVALDTRCQGRPALLSRAGAENDFDLAARRGTFELWVRRR